MLISWRKPVMKVMNGILKGKNNKAARSAFLFFPFGKINLQNLLKFIVF